MTYRARLSGTAEITSHTLLSYIEDWVSGGPSILVQGALLIIDHECPVSITAVDDGECIPDITTESPNFTRPVIIGGTVVAVVLIISTTLVIVVVLVRRSRHGRKLAVENISKLVICVFMVDVHFFVMTVKQHNNYYALSEELPILHPYSHPMSLVSGATGVQCTTGLATSSNISYKTVEQDKRGSELDHVLDDSKYPSVKPFSQSQGDEEEYTDPENPVSVGPTEFPSEDGDGETQEEIMYESVPEHQW